MTNIFVCRCLFATFIVISLLAIRANTLGCLQNRCNNALLTNCRCDKACYFYGDCCLDSPFLIQPYSKRNDISCVNATGEGFFMINGCSKERAGAHLIKTMCLHPTKSWKDPLIHAPVTSVSTNLTYRNAFCALCNGDGENTATWKLRLWCPPMVAEALRNNPFTNLVYNAEVRRWGYYMWDRTIGDKIFHSCTISFGVPESLEQRVRSCVVKEVSRCSNRWNDNKSRLFCMSYQNPVYDKRTRIRYRNVHCATCNFVYLRNLRCVQNTQISPTKTFNTFGASFGHNLNEVRVPHHPHCAENEVYDAFNSKCRRIICEIRGLIIMSCYVVSRNV